MRYLILLVGLVCCSGTEPRNNAWQIMTNGQEQIRCAASKASNYKTCLCCHFINEKCWGGNSLWYQIVKCQDALDFGITVYRE